MPDWLITLITNAGPTAAVMAFMWWQERKERLEMTDKLLRALDKQVDMGEAVRAVLNKNMGGDGDG